MCFLSADGRNAGLHFVCGLVGEGQCQDFFRGGSLFQQHRNTARKHSRLSGAGPRHYKDGAFGLQGRGFLLVVEAGEDVFYARECFHGGLRFCS